MIESKGPFRSTQELANLQAAIGGAFVRTTGQQPHFMLVDAIITGISGWLVEHEAADRKAQRAGALRENAALLDGHRRTDRADVAAFLREQADRIEASDVE